MTTTPITSWQQLADVLVADPEVHRILGVDDIKCRGCGATLADLPDQFCWAVIAGDESLCAECNDEARS